MRGASTDIYDIEVWAAQGEASSIATSYIPTNGATNTRLKDIAINSGNSSLINSTEGVLYAEIARSTVNNDYELLSISPTDNSDGTHYASLGYNNTDNKLWIRAKIGNTVAIASIGQVDTILNQFYKIAIKYKSGENAIYVNGQKLINTDITDGSETTTFTATPGTISNLEFRHWNDSNSFYGKAKALAVYKEALTDANLRCLTYPNPVATTFDLDFDTIAEQFTFTRGSEATFVNEQGLIQSTNELGAELVVNGDFSVDSNWVGVNTDGVTISNSSLNYLNTPYGKQIIQTNVTTIGKTYKVTYTVSNYVKGIVRVNLGGNSGQNYNANGTYTDYITASANTYVTLVSLGASGTTLSIDNVSVKEVISATNTPRLDYSTGEEAFLLEPQSTNLITYSEDFSDSSWVKLGGRSSVTINDEISPEGTMTATKFEAIQDSSDAPIRFTGITAGILHTLSIYAKKGNHDLMRIDIGDDTMNIVLTDNWERYTLTLVAPSNFVDISIRDVSIGDYIYIWGAQLEQQSYATSYIPTSGASATRNQETCADATPEINSEEGTLYAEIAALSDVTSLKSLSLSDGTTSNRVTIGLDNNTYYYQIRKEGTAVFGSGGLLTNVKLFNKIAVSYAENNFCLWINGTKVATGTSGLTPIGLNQLNFNLAAGSHKFFGNTKGLKVYPKALADVQLEDLTTI